MARRRNSSRRRRGRLGFLYKLLSILAICAVIVTALTLFFKVDTIQISGENRYSDQQILDAAGIQTGDNLFLLNKYSIASQLLKKLPYIEQVRINRTLPDTLSIDVTECGEPLKLVQDGVVWIISPSGKIVDRCEPAAAPDDPLIDGCTLVEPSVGAMMALPADRSSQQASLLALMKALEDADLLMQVQAIHLDDLSVLTVDCMDRFTVRLLYGTDYAYKMQNLKAVVGQLQDNETGTIDLTEDGKASFIP